MVHAYAGNLLTPRGSFESTDGTLSDLKFVEVPMSEDYRANKYKFLNRRKFERNYGKSLVRIILEEKPDVVISGNTPTEPQLAALLACRKMGIAFIPWIQDFYCEAVGKIVGKKLPIVGGFIYRWYRFLEGLILKKCQGIVLISEDFLPILNEFVTNTNNISVIPNWGALESISLTDKRNDWGVKQGLSDRFVFMYTGTLAMKHNPELLLGIANKFSCRDDVRLVVVSEGPGADWLKSEKASRGLNNVLVLPFQAFEEMASVLGTGDVLIAVLEEDAGVFSVPSKVLNYLCAGRGLIAAMPQENLASRIIKRSGAGFSVCPGDIKGFVELAERMWNDRKLRDECGAAARLYAENTFRIEDIAIAFEKVLVGAVEEGKA